MGHWVKSQLTTNLVSQLTKDLDLAEYLTFASSFNHITPLKVRIVTHPPPDAKVMVPKLEMTFPK
jgi:hypothetical protein